MTDLSQTQSQPTGNKLIGWLSGTLTLVLTVLSFMLSFNALRDLAAVHGVSIPTIFPLILEGAVIIFSLAALRKSLCGEDAKWQWTLIIGSSLLAGVFNVLHSDPDYVSRVMAACPSLFLLLSFETFLSQVKGTVKRQGTLIGLEELRQHVDEQRQELDRLTAERERMTANITDEREKLKAELATYRKRVTATITALDEKKSTLDTEITDLRREGRAQRQTVLTVSGDTRKRARAILTERGDISGAELGRALGKSDSLGRKLKRELWPEISATPGNATDNGR
jgi:Skp family chaperone for outer membrane proteins